MNSSLVMIRTIPTWSSESPYSSPGPGDASLNVGQRTLKQGECCNIGIKEHRRTWNVTERRTSRNVERGTLRNVERGTSRNIERRRTLRNVERGTSRNVERRRTLRNVERRGTLQNLRPSLRLFYSPLQYYLICFHTRCPHKQKCTFHIIL